jgi:hypothetical protein
MNSSAATRPQDTRPASVVGSVVQTSCLDNETTAVLPALDASTASAGVAMVTSSTVATFVLRKYGPNRLFFVDVTTALAAATPQAIALADLPPDIAILITNASGSAAAVTVGVVLRP